MLVGFGAGLTWAAAVVHWQSRPAEEEPILVADWPLPEQFRQPATRMRNLVWSAQVAARARLQDAAIAAITPVHRLRKRLRF